MALESWSDNLGNIYNLKKGRFKNAKQANKWLLFIINEAYTNNFITNFHHTKRESNTVSDALSKGDISKFTRITKRLYKQKTITRIYPKFAKFLNYLY